LAFTVTARHAGNSGITAASTLVSSSSTPTADSLLLVGMAAENNGGNADAQVWQTPTGGGHTYTQVAESPDAGFDGAATPSQYMLSAAMYRANVGGSPSAHTITVDAWAAATGGWLDVRACDITGHNTGSPVVQSKAAGTTKTIGDANSGTVVLDAVPMSGNLLVVYFASGADSGGPVASPTAGAGKTFTALSSFTGTWVPAGLWYRVCDGAESATITCSDLGDQVGNYGAVAVEIAAESTGSTPWAYGYTVQVG
jgi:hypothetical protein